MSLKAFHIVFIFTSILLTFLFAAWSFTSYFRDQGPVLHLIFGIGSSIAAIVLIWYSKYVLKKLKDISYL